jgi:hypothetical protein
MTGQINLGFAAVLFMLLYGTLLQGQQDKASTESPCYCAADKVALYAHDSTFLHFFAEDKNVVNDLEWTVDIGTITNTKENQVLWKTGAILPGIYYAHAFSDNKEMCKVRVVVNYRDIDLRGERRVSGKAFLVGNQKEPEGYGLYSYLLIPRASADQNEKYMGIISAVLKLNDVESLSEYIPRSGLNMFLIPVKEKVPKIYMTMEKEEDYRQAAQWILSHYNFTRSEALLSMIETHNLPGPFVISVEDPAHLANLDNTDYLYQNLTNLPDHLDEVWMRTFLNQAQQEEFWNTNTMNTFIYKIRLSIAAMAESVQSVEEATRHLLDWRKELIELR